MREMNVFEDAERKNKDSSLGKEVLLLMTKEEELLEDIALEGKEADEKARKEERTNTIVQAITNLLKQHQTKDYVLQTVMMLFSLDFDEALSYYEKAVSVINE